MYVSGYVVLLSFRLFAFVFDFVLHLSRSSSRFFPRKLYPYCRSDLTSPTSTQRSTDSAISSAQVVALGIIKSLVAPNREPLLSAPFTFFS